MRKPNHADAELLLHCYELRRDPEMRNARAWFMTAFHAQSWKEIRSGYLSHTDQDRWFRQVVTYWEMVATLVNRGVLHPDLFFDSTGEDIVIWERCRPWIAGARAAIRPTYLHNFEAMVARHLEFRARAAAAVAADGNGRAAAARGAPARRARARAR